jgi:osmotically-inducible protein OsmY
VNVTVPRISTVWGCDRHAVSRRRAVTVSVATSVISGLVVYFMDPERGRRRRNMARDRMLARMRRLARGMRGLWREAAAETYGVSHRIVHLVPRQTEVADDETLRQRVESQLFRDRHIPKGDLNINCEHGMVILRGELDTTLDIAQLEERVRRTPGVRGVQNLLHTHGTPAPNKQRSWNAARRAALQRNQDAFRDSEYAQRFENIQTAGDVGGGDAAR